MEAITIIGGGIAGLALGAGLDPERFDVTIHEQRPGVPAVETSLAMWPEAQAALAVLGVLPRIREAGTAFGGMALRDATGTALVAPEVRGVLGVSRADLIRILDVAVPASVRRVEGRVDEIPVTGPLASGLLVGADGVHSVVRRSFWGARSQARLTPYLALRGVLPVPVQADAGGEYWGRGQLFGITPAAGGRTYWYASFRSNLGPAGVDAAEALQQAKERFARNAPAIRTVLEQAPRPRLGVMPCAASPARTAPGRTKLPRFGVVQIRCASVASGAACSSTVRMAGAFRAKRSLACCSASAASTPAGPRLERNEAYQ